MPSSLWSSIPRKEVLANLLGMIDSEHEGTTMLSNTGKLFTTLQVLKPRGHESGPIMLLLNLPYQNAYLLPTTK